MRACMHACMQHSPSHCFDDFQKSRDLLVAQLKNSKEVVARITADNLMFLNKIKHCETKLEQAVKEREVCPGF